MSRKYISEKAQEKIFKQLLKRQENLTCADCCTKDPRYANIDFGVFICTDCARAHKVLGPTVARVRSIKSDRWLSENIYIMEAIGNTAANSYLEHQLPSNYVRPTIEMGQDTLFKFVEEKYNQKKFIPPFACDDPKTQYLKTKESIEPNYFYDAAKSPEVLTPSALQKDTIDMNVAHMDGIDMDFQEDEFQPFSSVSQKDTFTAHSISQQQQQQQQFQQQQFQQQQFQQQPQYQFQQQQFQQQHINQPINIIDLYGQK